MPSTKISLLALASAVAAVPHYGHEKFHARQPAGTGYGYGWSGYNSTRPTGTGSYGGTTTIDTTTTTTTTSTSIVIVRTSTAPSAVAEDATPAAGGQCGPATITVTASEKVTVTVTPGGGVDAPASSAPALSAAPVESQADEYGVPTSFALVSTTPAGEEVKPTPAPEQPAPPAPEPSPVESEVSSVVQPPVASEVYSTATPSETASPGTGTPTYTGVKRGLAYNDASLCKTFGGNFGFGYSWAQAENVDIGAPFIPMMHGPTKGTVSEWFANVEKAAKTGSTAVMGFNEPDHSQQANLDVDSACVSWKEYMNPVAESHPELTIIGPSVTNGPPPMGLDWLSRFHEACPEAIVHATNIHFYDIYEAATIDRFKAQVELAAELYGKPVWVTEFGLNPGSASQEQAASFLKEAMAYLDASDKVQGYAWFMVGDGENHLNVGTGLSALGQVYAS